MFYPCERYLVKKNKLALQKKKSLIIQILILQTVGFMFSFFKRRLLRNIFLLKEVV